MAHPCFECGSECYCHGNIDDVIVSKTPSNCKGCGCELDNYDDWGDDDWDYWGDDDWDYFICCDNCDLLDACADFGCAIKTGVRIPRTL